jgi:hypothetical protein
MMAKAYEVIEMLLPNGGYIMTGEEYEGIQFLECEPISKAQFEAGFAKFDAWKAQQEANAAEAKAAAEAKLAALGLTADDLKALGL